MEMIFLIKDTELRRYSFAPYVSRQRRLEIATQMTMKNVLNLICWHQLAI